MNRARLSVNVENIHRRGILGQGIGVAVLDTGNYPHPDYRDRICYFRDFVGGRVSMYDDCSHGSHVIGIVAGNGKMSGGRYRGIAPACHVMSLKVLDRKGGGNRRDVLEGIDWVIKNKDLYNIRILNISVGTEGEGNDADFKLVDSVERAWDAGLVVVVAAGNMGPDPMSITAPGNSKKVITVGSSDDFMKVGSYNNEKLYYSGRGPTRECVCKPDVVAPGSRIVSCSNMKVAGNGYYCTKSGTSMATPIVSGAVALLLCSSPGMTNVEVKMKLKETCDDIGRPRYQQGWGRINIGELLN